jgi:hypothetical protein
VTQAVPKAMACLVSQLNEGVYCGGRGILSVLGTSVWRVKWVMLAHPRLHSQTGMGASDPLLCALPRRTLRKRSLPLLKQIDEQLFAMYNFKSGMQA